MIKPILNTEINDSEWTEVSLSSQQTGRQYVIQSRDGSDFKISNTSSGSTYWTVRDGSAISVKDYSLAMGDTLFYAKSVSGTITIEVFIIDE